MIQAWREEVRRLTGLSFAELAGVSPHTPLNIYSV
jgi:hypothetical protein